MQYRSHPWHGVSAGKEAPQIVNTYIEIVPTDTLKYEMDKDTGILKVDRPQRFSNVSPSLYGFIPQTYCGEEVGSFCMSKTGKTGIVGDGDPLDICVLSEKSFTHGDILLRAIPIGGLRMMIRIKRMTKLSLYWKAIPFTVVGKKSKTVLFP